MTRTLVSAALLTLSLHAFAQQETPASSGATVSGRVLCADSNAPARFGKVFLKSTEAGGGAGDAFTKRLQAMVKNDKQTKPQTEEQKRVMASATKSMNRAADLLNGSTIGMNGEFLFTGVKPGTYYVHAAFTGYTDPLEQFSDEDLASTDPAVKARIAAAVPTITISGNEEAHTDLRIERGAAISGRVLYDDGTPAVGWTVTAIHPADEEDLSVSGILMQTTSTSGEFAKTDDTGHYRISGLLPGQYAVSALLNAMPVGVTARNISQGGSGITLLAYSGDTFDRSAAKTYKVAGNSERSGTDVTIPSRTLHSIVGHVTAKTDGHPLNNGSVMLTSKSNPALHLKAAVRDDGSFHYDYLPPATYTLSLDGAADARITGSSNMLGMSIPKQEILRKYEAATTEVTLGNGDVDSVTMAVTQTDWTPPVKKPGAKEMDPGKALGTVLGTMLGGDEPDEKTK